eukprot:GDKI01033850.1.p2 GENE.GDKI01033850.1~~GDKI01033850.1.p2  ORF type:complete len:100 (+),score=8.50 GDKI01033850.1:45-344(+)
MAQTLARLVAMSRSLGSLHAPKLLSSRLLGARYAATLAKKDEKKSSGTKKSFDNTTNHLPELSEEEVANINKTLSRGLWQDPGVRLTKKCLVKKNLPRR